MTSRLPFTRAVSVVPLTASKVPEVTVLFWLVKVVTTGMGESSSDFLVHSIDPFVAVGIGAVFCVGALVVQLAADRYRPWVYWFAVVMVSVFGTMAADVTHIVLGVPYLVSTIVFAVLLALVFFVWQWHSGSAGSTRCSRSGSPTW